MQVSTIRSVSRTSNFKYYQFIRFLLVPSLAHFTPHIFDSDSGSEDLNSNSTNDVIAPDYDDSSGNKKCLEINSSEVVQILQNMKMEPMFAFSFFKKLKEKGFQHDTCSYLAMIKVLCFWGMNHKLNSLFTEVINSKGENLCFQMSELLEAMTEELKANGASSLVRAFDALVKTYVSLGMFDEAIRTLFAIIKHSFGQCLSSCNFLMNKLLEHRKFGTTIAIYEQLKDDGLNPSVYTYGIAVKAYCQARNLEEAADVFVEMEKAGVLPNALTCAAYLEELCKVGRSDDAYKFLQACKDKSVPMDTYAYTIVIRGFVRENKPNEALVVHDKMEANGIRTNVLIITPILQCLCLKGMYSIVIKKFNYYKMMAIALDKVIYNVAIDALCKMGRLDEAEKLFDEMKLKNLVPDIRHYTTLIHGHCLNGNICHALHLFKEMDKNGLRPDIVIYNVLAGGLYRNGRLDEMFWLLDATKREGLTPNAVTHKMIIKGLCFRGRVKEAEIYVCNLEEKSIENYSAVVNGYCESGKATEGFNLFRELCVQRILISRDSCAKLISSLCHAGDMEKAQWVFNQMSLSGRTPNAVMYTIMLKGYCQVKCLQKAFALFCEMKRKGIIPDIITYTVLVDGYCKVTLHDQTQKGLEGRKIVQQVVPLALLREMNEMDLKPDLTFYTVLIDSLCKLENLQDAVSLFDELIKQGLSPDTVTYTSLISGCFKQGNIGKALTLVTEMKSKGIQLDRCTRKTLHYGIMKEKKTQFH